MLAWPDTVSAEFVEAHQAFVDAMLQHGFAPPPENAQDTAGFVRQRQHMARLFELHTQAALDRHAGRVLVTTDTVAGLQVTALRPQPCHHDDRLIVHLAGGGYTLGSGRAALPALLPLSLCSGLRVLAPDYSRAPEARWPQVIAELLAFFDALAAQGLPAHRIALCGDSAGGGLAAGLTLALRDSGRPMPAALALWSPWADLALRGDSLRTLAAVDFITEAMLRLGADAYAGPADHCQAVVSPVYGDFGPGFPPTLVQCGTRETLLSDAVRLVQALEDDGRTVRIELYDGMPHVHQQLVPTSPEGRRAIARTAAFLTDALR